MKLVLKNIDWEIQNKDLSVKLFNYLIRKYIDLIYFSSMSI